MRRKCGHGEGRSWGSFIAPSRSRLRFAWTRTCSLGGSARAAAIRPESTSSFGKRWKGSAGYSGRLSSFSRHPPPVPDTLLTIRLLCYHSSRTEVLDASRPPNHPNSHRKLLLRHRGRCTIWLRECSPGHDEPRRAPTRRYLRNDRPPHASCDGRSSWRPLFRGSRVYPDSHARRWNSHHSLCDRRETVP